MVRFTDHALNRMKARQLNEKDVIKVLRRPRETIATRANRLVSYGQIGGNYIVVVHQKEGEDDVIITVLRVDKRRLWRFGFVEV